VTMTTIITGPSVLFVVRALGEATVSGTVYEAKTSFVETVGPSVTWHQTTKSLLDFHEIRRRRSQRRPSLSFVKIGSLMPYLVAYRPVS
jgi:hypothetical protein